MPCFKEKAIVQWHAAPREPYQIARNKAVSVRVSVIQQRWKCMIITVLAGVAVRSKSDSRRRYRMAQWLMISHRPFDPQLYFDTGFTEIPVVFRISDEPPDDMVHCLWMTTSPDPWVANGGVWPGRTEERIPDTSSSLEYRRVFGQLLHQLWNDAPSFIASMGKKARS